MFTYLFDLSCFVVLGRLSVWPVLSTIVNFPTGIRFKKKNMLLLGLFSAIQKPADQEQWSYLMSPILHEIKSYTIRFSDSDIRSFDLKIRLVICDLPAQAALLAHTQFNGFFGCLFCYQKGEKLNEIDLKKVLVRPYMTEPAAFRTNESYENDRRREENGSMGPSCMDGHVSIPDQISIDYMHQSVEVNYSFILFFASFKVCPFKVLR